MVTAQRELFHSSSSEWPLTIDSKLNEEGLGQWQKTKSFIITIRKSVITPSDWLVILSYSATVLTPNYWSWNKEWNMRRYCDKNFFKFFVAIITILHYSIFLLFFLLLNPPRQHPKRMTPILNNRVFRLTFISDPR